MTIANGVNSLGLPERLSGAGHLYFVGKADEAEIAKAKRYSRLGNAGMLLLLTGFMLQLISNFL